VNAGRAWQFRQLLVLVSVVTSLVADGPVTFMLRVMQRFSLTTHESIQFLQRCTHPLDSELKPRQFLLPGHIAQSVSNSWATEPRVLYFATNSLPHSQAGYAIRTQQLLEAIKDSGTVIRCSTRLGYPLVVGRFSDSFIEKIKGVEYSRLLPFYMPISQRQRLQLCVKLLTREAREFGATVLHTTTDYRNAFVVSQAAKALGIPWIYEVRGERHNTWASALSDTNESEYYRYAATQENLAMRLAAKVIVTGERGRSNAVLCRGAESDVIVLPNAVSSGSSREDVYAERKGEQACMKPQTVIGSVSSIVAYEGFGTLIEALKYLPENFVVKLVGDGEDKGRLQRLADELGVSDRVQLVGRKSFSEIDYWYSQIDIFVIPRIDSEVTRNVVPIKQMRALQLGIPVVASEIPALVEGTGGFATYFQPGDSLALAFAVQEVSLGKQSFSRRDLEDWLKERTWEGNAATINSVYKSLTK